MMLEADALANRIAIVKRGRLRVVGSQQHLKVSSISTQWLSTNCNHSHLPKMLEHLW